MLAVGDTTTVVTTSLLAFYRRIKFGHVEAGLRTHNKWHPFPEEINRRLATVTADLHFAPTEWSQGNLLREGVDEKTLWSQATLSLTRLNLYPNRRAAGNYGYCSSNWELADRDKKIILVTAHRRENFGKPLENICSRAQRTGSA